jgi:hypothetical protein
MESCPAARQAIYAATTTVSLDPPMTPQHSAYRGTHIALATMHGKFDALAPAFSTLGATLVVAENIDTDALGTFSGEVARRQPPLETAVAKARLAMVTTGLPLGLATEGSFGPDPVIGMVPLHREIAVLVDDTRGIIVNEQFNSHETNYTGCWLGAKDIAMDGTQVNSTLGDAQLLRWGFPEHALIVRSEPFAPGGAVRKGIVDRAALEIAIRDCLAASPEGRVRVETDMRAHLNPTRMRNIAILGERLVQRLRQHCPQCDAPGFGRTDVVTGLPCEACDMPTSGVLAEVYACVACGHCEQRPRSDGRAFADPAHCDRCNP